MKKVKRVPAHYTVIQVNEYEAVLDELLEHADYDEVSWGALAGYLADCAHFMRCAAEGGLVYASQLGSTPVTLEDVQPVK